MSTRTLSEKFSLADTMDEFRHYQKILGKDNVSFETTRTGYRVFEIIRSVEQNEDTNLSENEENEEKHDENSY
jgi:hypothetical protein